VYYATADGSVGVVGLQLPGNLMLEAVLDVGGTPWVLVLNRGSPTAALIELESETLQSLRTIPVPGGRYLRDLVYADDGFFYLLMSAELFGSPVDVISSDPARDYARGSSDGDGSGRLTNW